MTTDYPQLLEALRRRQLALFLGADLPREATGLPSRAELARELARRHTLDETLPLAEVAQRVSQAGNRFDFTDFIRNALDTTGKPPQPFHQRIAALVREHRIETLITTAYDSLLEIAFQQAGVGLNRVVRGGDASFIASERPTLIYLYGKADQPDTLVVTDRDHSELLRDRDKEALVDEVRQTLRRKTVLFLGYNLADPGFRFLFDHVAESRFARMAYAVWPGLPEADKRMWRDRGVTILEADPLGVLGGAVAQTAPPGRVEAEVDVPTGAKGLAWDTATLRRLLTEALGDEEMDRLCYDHFRSVYDEFSGGMGKGQKVHRLLEHCDRQGQVGKLVDLVRERNPAKFAQIAGVSPRPPTTPPASPQPTQAPAAQPEPPAKRTPVAFKLQLSRTGEQAFEIRALESPMGEPRASSGLPYPPDKLPAVLKTLDDFVRLPDALVPRQTESYRELGLLPEGGLASDLLQHVGQRLYDALVSGDVRDAFRMALAQTRASRVGVGLQLRFDQDAVELARYPWELIHDGRRALLPSRAVELTRYISYPEALTALPAKPPLRVLYLQSRPSALSELAADEQAAVKQALAQLGDEAVFQLETLEQATYEALLDYLEDHPVHVLHFDGHGVLARRCPRCGAMNYPHYTRCQNERDGSPCGQEIAGVKPLGYLAFEKAQGEVNWVSSELLGSLLYNRPVRLAVLSACRSGGVSGETLFGGVAPALIQAGVPAVVSNQFPLSADVAVGFMRGFYRALARSESVPAAVNAGRLRVLQSREWFIPTVYLRSQDNGLSE